MPLSPRHREELTVRTREAAAALIEDLQYMREVLARANLSRAEVRRLSVTLRRVLVDRDLSKVAAPRIGRIEINAPDNKPIVKSNKRRPIGFFGSAGVEAFGIELRCFMLDKGSARRPLPEFDPGRIVKLRLDGFLSQPVLCLNGEFATRAQVIDYVANLASGAHSGSPETAPSNKREAYKRLARMRQAGSYSVKGGVPTFTINTNVIANGETPFKYTPDAIDPVYLELVAAAHYLVTSEDVAKLEKAVRKELEAHT